MIAVLGAFAEHIFAWWSIAVAAFLMSFLFNLKPGQSFLSGFLAISIFWLIYIIKADTANEHILSQKMAVLISLPNYALFIIVNVVLGGLVGGLGSLSGVYIRRMV
jgi:hypothetical protein